MWVLHQICIHLDAYSVWCLLNLTVFGRDRGTLYHQNQGGTPTPKRGGGHSIPIRDKFPHDRYVVPIGVLLTARQIQLDVT